MTMAEILGPIGPLGDHAERYADAGLEVFPVNPADKRPMVSQHLATVDAATIYGWWKAHPDALIGHRIGAAYVLTDVDPRHGGDATWRALREEVGESWPATRAHASGRGDGGGHSWWQRPEGRLSIRPLNDWARARGLGHPVCLADGTETDRWSAGIDLLHHGHRYTILPPSPHPETAEPYRWVDGRGMQAEPLPMPELLAGLLVEAPAPPALPLAPRDEDSIADWYSSTARWGDLLARHGWQLVSGDGDADGSAWRHPAATSAVSATIRHRCLFVYSPNTPFEPTEQGDVHGYTLFRAYAVLEHHGDASAAARAAREARGGPSAPRIDVHALVGQHPVPAPVVEGEASPVEDEVQIGSSWRRTELAEIVAGLRAGTLAQPTPSLGRLVGGAALWYPGRVNGLYGEPGKGKTWIALAVVAEVLADGGSVAWIDLEEPAPGIVTRLLDLGVAGETVVERFAHFAPEETIRHARALEDELVAMAPDLAVIDSTGEALAIEGAGPNNDDEVASWFRTWPRWIAKLTGAGVVVIDHVVKDEHSRGLWPGGSQRKKAAINGAAFMATPIRELGRGHEGRLKLVTSKDRQGHHRTGTKAAEFVLDARTPGALAWRLEAPEPLAEGETFRPTGLMERVSAFLESQDEPVSGRAVEQGVKGKGEYVRKALAVLVEEGFVAVRIEDRLHLHTLVRAYREVAEIAPVDGAERA